MQQKRSLLSILENYCKRGFYLFPLNGKTKAPVFKDMLNKASNDIEKLEAWSKRYPGCGWGLSLAKSGLWAVDIDTKHSGMEVWQGLIESNGEIETLVQVSGSGGLHYIFQHEKDQKLKGKIRRGIDIKHNGYIVLYPTIHKSGNQYYWRGYKGRKPISAPEWLKKLCEKTNKPSTAKGSPNYKLGTNYLKKLVEELEQFDLSYDEWVQAGMALHKASGGSDEGKQLYLELTQGASYQEGDLEKAESKWESFDAESNDGVTARTLTYLIRLKGGIVPNPSFESDIKAFRETQASAILKEAEENTGWFKEGKKMVCVHTDFVVEDFNRRGYAFYVNGGNAPILMLRKGPEGQKEVKTLALTAFQAQTAPFFFKYYKMLANGDRKACYAPASKVWLESFDRKSFNNIVFKPLDQTEKGELNLWSDIPCKRVEGDVTLFTLFVEQCLCNNDKNQTEWLLNWLAHLVQKPWEKPTTVPVLIGDQGTGKGLLADGVMKRILKHFYYRVMTAQNLKEKFNKEQSQKFLVFIDEATWRGDKVEDGILKSLTGSDTITIEEKHGARYNIENYARYIIASNNEEAVRFERSNRRYNFIRCNDNFAGKTEYFKPLWDGLKKGKLANQIFNFLMERDITSFNPFELPKGNLQGRTVKVRSEGVVAQFWEDVFFENPRELWLKGEFLARENTYQEFLNFCSEIKTYERNLSRHYFWKKTSELIPLIHLRGNRPRDAKINGARPVVSQGDPEAMAKKFSETLSIEPPYNLDVLDYFLDDDFAE